MEAVEGFLGSDLMRLFLAVAHSIAGIDTAQFHGCAENGVVVIIGRSVNEFIFDGDVVLLRPLDEA